MTPLERIFDRAVPEPNSGCFLWPGAVDQSGYGRLTIGNRQFSAHRVVFEATEGPLLDGEQALHRCDVRCCVNPAHLFRGDHRANMDDMKAKGRARAGRTGAAHHSARLTPEALTEIRATTGNGPALARKFGVSPQAIYKARKGRSWTN